MGQGRETHLSSKAQVGSCGNTLGLKCWLSLRRRDGCADDAVTTACVAGGGSLQIQTLSWQVYLGAPLVNLSKIVYGRGVWF